MPGKAQNIGHTKTRQHLSVNIFIHPQPNVYQEKGVGMLSGERGGTKRRKAGPRDGVREDFSQVHNLERYIVE